MYSIPLFQMPRSWTDESVSLAAVLLILLANTFTDLHRRRIALPVTAAAALFGLAQSAAAKRSPAELLLALLPGLFLVLISFPAKGSIGGGDGIVITALGFFLPVLAVLSLCAYAFLFAALPAGILLLRGRRGSENMPFLPFVLLSFVILQGVTV